MRLFTRYVNYYKNFSIFLIYYKNEWKEHKF